MYDSFKKKLCFTTTLNNIIFYIAIDKINLHRIQSRRDDQREL